MKVISRSRAKSNGLKYYFTGVKCKHGHIAQRNTSHCKCIECNKLSSKTQYKNDPEKCKADSKANNIKTNGAAVKKYAAKRKHEKAQLKLDVMMNITTKVDVCVGLMTASQIDNLVDCGVANYDDFTQRKQYNEYRFTGDKDTLFVTSWSNLKSIKRFTVEIDCNGISIT